MNLTKNRGRKMLALALLVVALLGNMMVPTSKAAKTPVASAAMPVFTAVGWGNNDTGQLNFPANLDEVTAIAAGQQHSLVLKNNDTVDGWGSNDFGQLNIPSGLNGVTAIAAGELHSLALKSDGTVVGWGKNNAGQATPLVGL